MRPPTLSKHGALRMLPAVAVLTAGAFAAAACAEDARSVADLSPEGRAGRQAYIAAGCATCHGLDGSSAAAPGVDDMWGTTITLTDGTTTAYDAEYVTTSVRDPQAQQRQGVTVTQAMQAYDTSTVSDEDLAGIIAYIRDLGPRAAGS